MMSKNERLLIAINALYFLAGTMANVFVSVYLFTFTGSLYSLIAYTMVRFFWILMGFFVSGFLSKWQSLAQNLTIGLALYIASLALLLTINPWFSSLPLLIFVIGTLFGFGEGFYWFSVNILNQSVSTKGSRPRFIAFAGIYNAGATIVAPIVATIIVTVADTDTLGYLRIFQVVIAILMVVVYLSTRVKIDIIKRSFTVIDKLNLSHDSQWRYQMIAYTMFGVRESQVLVLTGLLIFIATGGSGSVYGNLLTLFAILSMAANYLVARKVNRQNRMQWYRLGSLLLFSSTMVLVFVPNLYGAIYFGVVNAIATPFLNNPFMIIAMNALQDYSDNESLSGRIIAREVYLISGRLVGMGSILVFAWALPEPLSLYVAVTFCSVFGLMLAGYASAYHKKKDALAV
jgi:YQGE family putative transporter